MYRRHEGGSGGNVIRKSAFLAVGCCALVACVTSKPFVMPSVDAGGGVHIASEYAASGTNSALGPHILIVSIDGAPTKKSSLLARVAEEAYVTPGPHVFGLRYVMGTMVGGVALSLNAQPGHEYIIEDVEGSHGGLRLRFRDGWNGPVVGGLAD